jgi:hypothetical protein
MTLTTHAIVGGALASLFQTQPIAAIAVGVASHFAIDAIPHWVYLRSYNFGRLRGDWPAIGLFSAHAPVLLEAIASMLPDPLQFVHSLHPREPLATLQRFHWWIHSKRKLDWPMGVVRRFFSRR